MKFVDIMCFLEEDGDPAPWPLAQTGEGTEGPSPSPEVGGDSEAPAATAPKKQNQVVEVLNWLYSARKNFSILPEHQEAKKMTIE